MQWNRVGIEAITTVRFVYQAKKAARNSAALRVYTQKGRNKNITKTTLDYLYESTSKQPYFTVICCLALSSHCYNLSSTLHVIIQNTLRGEVENGLNTTP